MSTLTKNPITAEQALAQIRAMATKGVPNCINLDAIDRIMAQVQPDAAHLQAQALQLELDGYKEWGVDVKSLTRKLDVALFGADAAQQASLCDLVGPTQKLGEELASLRKFKTCVHGRLDEAGIDPHEEQNAINGCRIGARLDAVLKPIKPRKPTKSRA